MSNDHRESSGGSTVMIVVAILGGILLLGCCGGTVVIGSIFMVGMEARDVQFQPMAAPPPPVMSQPPMQAIEVAQPEGKKSTEAEKAAEAFPEEQDK